MSLDWSKRQTMSSMSTMFSGFILLFTMNQNMYLDLRVCNIYKVGPNYLVRHMEDIFHGARQKHIIRFEAMNILTRMEKAGISKK